MLALRFGKGVFLLMLFLVMVNAMPANGQTLSECGYNLSFATFYMEFLGDYEVYGSSANLSEMEYLVHRMTYKYPSSGSEFMSRLYSPDPDTGLPVLYEESHLTIYNVDNVNRTYCYDWIRLNGTDWKYCDIYLPYDSGTYINLFANYVYYSDCRNYPGEWISEFYCKDYQGNYYLSDRKTLTIIDDYNPRVTFTSPAVGFLLGETVDVSFNVYENSKLAEVRLEMINLDTGETTTLQTFQDICFACTRVFDYSWDTSLLAGAYMLRAYAEDNSGNIGEDNVSQALATMNNTDPSWLPEANIADPSTEGNNTSFTVKLLGSEQGIIRFYLEEISSYRGYCMNAGTGDDPDYEFVQGSQNDANITVTTLNTAETASPANEATIVVSSYDFGGKAKIRAEVEINGEVHDVIIIDTILPYATIPVDDDDNGIGDAWTHSSFGLPPFEDLDSIPHCEGATGDGLTNYEEYRGFVCLGNHARTDPDNKDLFLFYEDDKDRLKYGMGDISILPVNLHEMYKSEVGGAYFIIDTVKAFGTVNFNCFERGSFLNQINMQKALFLRFSDKYIETKKVTSKGVETSIIMGKSPGGSTGGNPNTTAYVALFIGSIQAISPTNIGETSVGIVDPLDGDAINSLLGHEGGHGVGIKHYNESDDYSRTLTVMVTAYLPSATSLNSHTWNNIPHLYDADDIKQIRLH